MATVIEIFQPQFRTEKRTYPCDFTDDLLDGVTVTGGTIVHTPPSGSGNTIGTVVASPFINATLGTVSVTGKHFLDITAGLSNGEIAAMRLVIPVIEGAACRSTLGDLVTTLRGLTDAGYLDWQLGTATFWDDMQLQIALDRHRVDIYREQLTARPGYAGSGTIQYKEYRSGYNNLEQSDGSTTLFLEDGAGTDFGTALWSADYARGIVTFAADTGGSVVYLTGRSYDLNAAAADVWRIKAANAAKLYDMSTDNHSLSRSQIKAHCIEMAEYYESQGGFRVVTMVRSDLP